MRGSTTGESVYDLYFEAQDNMDRKRRLVPHIVGTDSVLFKLRENQLNSLETKQKLLRSRHIYQRLWKLSENAKVILFFSDNKVPIFQINLLSKRNERRGGPASFKNVF